MTTSHLRMHPQSSDDREDTAFITLPAPGLGPALLSAPFVVDARPPAPFLPPLDAWP